MMKPLGSSQRAFMDRKRLSEQLGKQRNPFLTWSFTPVVAGADKPLSGESTDGMTGSPFVPFSECYHSTNILGFSESVRSHHQHHDREALPGLPVADLSDIQYSWMTINIKEMELISPRNLQPSAVFDYCSESDMKRRALQRAGESGD
ncbi:unnamed protein product [Caretta caretta]